MPEKTCPKRALFFLQFQATTRGTQTKISWRGGCQTNIRRAKFGARPGREGGRAKGEALGGNTTFAEREFLEQTLLGFYILARFRRLTQTHLESGSNSWLRRRPVPKQHRWTPWANGLMASLCQMSWFVHSALTVKHKNHKQNG